MSRSPAERAPSDRASDATAAAVWLVEDNALFRSTIAGLLDEQPRMHCPVAVATCEEALALIESEVTPEIVLLDIGLPGIDGIEGARRIRQRSPETRVIMLTVHDERDTIFEAIRAGASGYLLKSSDARSILAALHDVLAGGAPLNAHIARKILDDFQSGPDRRSEYGLTPRESEILELMVEGITLRQLAERVGVSVHTVDTHVRNIYAKLHVRSRGGAVAKAVKERLV